MMQWSRLLGAKRKIEDKPSGVDPRRSPFETDFDRIVFSHPFRRLQDKTQVHPLPEYDFVHTRLSHSLEVSSVGRSLGKNVGFELLDRHPELKKEFTIHDFGGIVAAASLAHDIGNPPFGHSGETAIGDFFRFHANGSDLKSKMKEAEWLDLTKFEGNAQGFRILNSERYEGLKLTFATMASFSKYPRESITSPEDGRRSQKKFGFFQAEKQPFADMANELGLLPRFGKDNCWARHPLTFLVEAADDICYSIIDLEDGCRLGLVGYQETMDLLVPIIGDRFDPSKLNAYRSQEEKIGVLRALAIARLIEESTQVFLENENAILSGDFDESLTDVIPSFQFLKHISKVSFHKIYRSQKVVETETVGFRILPGILEVITEAALQYSENREGLTGRQASVLRMIPELEIVLGDPPYKVLMACTDFISNMTDTAALSFYRKLHGIDLPKA